MAEGFQPAFAEDGSTMRHVLAAFGRPEILDACCGGRMWHFDKDNPHVLYMDKRVASAFTPEEVAEIPWDYVPNKNWKCEPDVVADFTAMPFDDGTFQLVVFDPPHVVSDRPSGMVTRLYGALHPATEQEDISRGFAECWRVLRPGGTLVFKWAGPLKRVKPHFPAQPVVGTRRVAGRGLGTRWFIFDKPLEEIGAEVAA